MNSNPKTSRVLGLAFLMQFVTSIVSGMLLRSALIVPGDIGRTMVNIAGKPGLMRAYILVDMLTALGIAFLGAILFLTLRKQNEKIALTALVFYILEATLLAVSRMEAFSLLGLSQQYASAGNSATLLTMGNLALGSMDFAGSVLHMLAFCLGGILFYYLLYRSGVVPRLLSLWGLITVFPCLAGTLFAIFGTTVPFFVYLPYAPFELVIAIWILVKGIKDEQA
ncbi:MAG TPA: DUF4386 domain-containing protein [Anaerolineales bacterium]